MAHSTDTHRVQSGTARADFFALLGKAIVSGLATSAILVLLVLGLAATASV